MKKAFGQTVRDLKRGVNKKVLKVPSIEQKVLDATSNEPWGPHGTLLADIAQATRNYHEYQMIMSVLWKRTNDTGKNWRHVFKALTVLEYLVAHGSERVIDDIREHAYQLQTLSDFQYIDSGGRDQGINVRRKSQGLVVLVNDKERILEVREKAASNREKFRNTPDGGMNPPGSYSGSAGHGDRYDDDRYGNRDDERNGPGRGREYGYRGDDRYAYGRDGREYEERYGGDDDYRGRSHSVDNRSSRGRSSDRDKFEDDDQYSSRGSGARADEQSQDGRSFNHRFSEQNLGAPPSYEEVVGGAVAAVATHSPTQSERDGDTAGATPERSSLTASSSPTQATSTSASTLAPNLPAVPAVDQNEADGFDEFDPRGSYSAAPTISDGAAPTMSVGGEMDLLGSLSDSFTANPLALVSTSLSSTNEVSNLNNSVSTFMETSATSAPNQGFDDLFGDGPFKAMPPADGEADQEQQGFGSMSFQSGLNQGFELPQQVSQGPAEGPFSGANSTPFGASNVQLSQDAAEGSFSSTYSTPFGASNGQPSQGAAEGSFSATYSTPFGSLNGQPSQGAAEGSFSATYSTPFGSSNGQPSSMNAQYQQQEFSTHDPSIDILADILPPTGPQPDIQPDIGYAPAVGQVVPQSGFLAQTGQNVSPATFSSQRDQTAHQSDFPSQSGQPSSLSDQHVQEANLLPQTGENMSQATFPSQSGPTAQQAGFPAQSSQPTALAGFDGQPGQLVVHPDFPSQFGQADFSAHGGRPSSMNGYVNQDAQAPQTGFAAQSASVAGFSFQMNQLQHGGFQNLPGGQAAPPNPVPYSNYNMQSGHGAPVGQNMVPQVSAGLTSQLNGINSTAPSQMPYTTGQVGSSALTSSQSDLPSSALIPSTAPPPAKDKQFQTKSTVWADTLSRGLVNLDISGVKTNPLSDIGVDFDSINRKEKRMEKPATTPVSSTIHMGKAMGSGSGMGRAGAGAIRPPPNPMMGAGMDMGMGGPRPGVGMGGYGGMNQQAMGGGGMGGYGGMNQQAMAMGGFGGMNHQAMGGGMGGYGGMNQQAMGAGMGGYGGMNQQGMGGGMGMNMQPNMGMMGHPNMNMGGQMQQPGGFPPGSNTQGGYNPNMGGQMQQPAGFPPGSNMQGGYNPMMGAGNYGQNPYGGGSYRSV